MDMVPVHRPKLVSSHLIAPYLKRIDSARWYSNFGPLHKEFEERLAAHFNIFPNQLTTAANGTLMLTCILKALKVTPGQYCVLPSWTFIATAAAVEAAGLIPYFVDVDQDTQALNVDKLKLELSTLTHPIAAIIAVAPFGAPINTQKWEAFSQETAIPVIVDAAACFDSLKTCPELTIGTLPIMVSMHATKVFGIGEGGLVLSTDAELVWKIRSMTSFGFNLEREAEVIGMNAKLSEYAAAIGLASLDVWDETRSAWEEIKNTYCSQLKKYGIAHWMHPNYVSSTCNIIAPGQAKHLAQSLYQAGIDTRKWWLNGCHTHPAYQHFPRSEDLSNTEWLSDAVLGLPFAVDLSKKNIEYVTSMTQAALFEKRIALG